MGKNFKRNPVIRIDPNVIAGFESRLHQLGGALEDQRLQPMFRANTEPIGAEHLRDFRDRAGGFETEVAHNHIGFVDKNTRAFFELREMDARIDVAIIIRSANDNVRRLPRWVAEVSTDAVRGRGHLFDDFLELLDHLLRFADRLFLGGNFRPQDEQLATIPIFPRDGSENKIECVEQT